jgi:hypothetical protein
MAIICNKYHSTRDFSYSKENPNGDHLQQIP